MKLLAFNGSPRKDGNTFILINLLFREVEKEGIETELIQLSEKEIQGCMACYKCFENKNRRCVRDVDAANEYIEKLTKSEGIVLGSPAHFLDVTPKMKAVMDRAGLVSLANGGMYKNKVGAAVAAFRRSGAMHTIDEMNHFFLSMGMIIAGRGIAIGREKKEVEKDAEGIELVKALGQRTAWLMKKLYA